MKCSDTNYKDAPGFCLQEGGLELTVLRRGAKIQSLRHCGKELLWQSESRHYKFSGYGDDFMTGECSGFDEMFPTIAACPYPDGLWRGTELPDHGEVWTQDWDASADSGGVTLSVYGVRLPYKLTKRVSLEGSDALLDYHAKNLSGYPLKYIWAADPLFVLEEGMRIELNGCTEIINVSDDPGGGLGAYGEKHPWPQCSPGRDLSVLSRLPKRFNKYYVWDALAENKSSLIYPDGRHVTLSAPADVVPYLGVWTDEGGFMGRSMFCAAPEPCTGALDRLDTADLFGKVSTLPPRGSASWRLTVSLGHIY